MSEGTRPRLKRREIEKLALDWIDKRYSIEREV